MDGTTRMLGGWGWVAALVLAVIPGLNVLSLAGAVCVFVAMWRASEKIGQPRIRRQLIVSVVLSALAGGAFALSVGVSILELLTGHPVAGWGAGVILGGTVAWICYVVAAWFWYQACAGIAAGSDAPLLKTGGLLGFVGALCVVVFGVGAILAFVGAVLQTIAFFTAPERREAPIQDS